MYRRTFDPDAQDSLAKLSRWVPAGTTVLELGPAAGYFTRHLRDVGCTVDVIEIDAEAAHEVSGVARTVIVGDLALAATFDQLATRRYDVIVCADVLEHLVDGKALLARLRALLAPRGELLLSVPNVAHSAIIAELLDEHFDYGGEGLLDPTHVRLYTRRSIASALDAAGFVVDEWDVVVVEAFATEFRTRIERLRPDIARLLLNRPNAFVYQWLVRARAADGSPGAAAPARQDVEHVALRVLTAESPDQLTLDHARVLPLDLGAPTTRFESDVPVPSGALRIMLPDRVGVLVLSQLEFCAGERVVWTLAVESDEYRTSGDLVRLDEARFALLDANTWIEPVLASGVARSVDRIRLAAGWPTPPEQSEAFALFEGLAGALVSARSRATQEIDSLKRLIAERDVQLEGIDHLKRQVAERDALLDARARLVADCEMRLAQAVERATLLDARAAALTDSLNLLAEKREEVTRLEAALAAQERIIAYRHSLSWWLQLPWLVLRSWWQRIADR